MIKTLTKHGNSYALIIDKAILELLKISPGTELELSTDGKVLTVSPVNGDSHTCRLREVLDDINEQHHDTLRKLAE